MKRKVLLGLAVLTLTSALVFGCTSKPPEEDGKVVDEINNEAAIMKDFEALAADQDLKEVITYVKDHIGDLSEDNASKMVLQLEEMQKEQLSSLEERYFAEDSIQQTLIEAYEAGEWKLKIEDIEDENVKALLQDTIDQGYKVETAEGTFFPVIDYGNTAQFSDYTTDDINAYLQLMKTESDEVAVKDAAIVIEWKEVAERALNQQEFLEAYGDSEKSEDVENLYGRYVNLLVFGANNTPAFSYDSKKLEPELQEIYKALAAEEDGKLKELFTDYLPILEKSQYTMTEEVSQYRDQMTKPF